MEFMTARSSFPVIQLGHLSTVRLIGHLTHVHVNETDIRFPRNRGYMYYQFVRMPREIFHHVCSLK